MHRSTSPNSPNVTHKSMRQFLRHVQHVIERIATPILSPLCNVLFQRHCILSNSNTKPHSTLFLPHNVLPSSDPTTQCAKLYLCGVCIRAARCAARACSQQSRTVAVLVQHVEELVDLRLGFVGQVHGHEHGILGALRRRRHRFCQ